MENKIWDILENVRQGYITVNDGTQQVLDLLPDVMHHVCPDCEGRKYFPDKKSTSGQKPCNRCWGTGQIVP